MAEGVASLLCHDLATARKYYDVNRGVTSAWRTRKILSQKMEVCETSSGVCAKRSLERNATTTTAANTTPTLTSTTTTTNSTTTTSQSEAGPSRDSPFNIKKNFEKLKTNKLTPKEKFLTIIKEAGPVRLSFENLSKGRNTPQLKARRAKIIKSYESILAANIRMIQDEE